MTSVCLAAGALAQSGPVPVDANGYAGDTYPVEKLGPVDDAAGAAALPGLTQNELEDLVGPIALYPDDLLAIVLPASTYPLQIVQAARFLDEYERDNSLQPDEEWDESVVALLNYPDVLRMLNEDIDWTWQLGEAVIAQQADVISAVETFRDRAYVAGNLKSDQHQNVVMDDGIIEIVPIEDDVIYVPYYDPVRVVVAQPVREYYYYPRPYPVYYYPYPAGYNFATGYFWGVTTAFQMGWATQHVHVHHPSYWGHPFYGHHYYSHYYRRPSITVYNTLYVNNSRFHSADRYRHGDYWRPNRRTGSRQSDYYQHSRHYRSDYRADLRPDVRVRTSGTRESLRERNRANPRTLAGAVTARERQREDTDTRPVMRNRNDSTRSAGRSQSLERAPAAERAPIKLAERRQTPPTRDTRVTRTPARTSLPASTNTRTRAAAERVTAPAARQSTSTPRPAVVAPQRQSATRTAVASPRQSSSRPSVARQPARQLTQPARVERQASPRADNHNRAVSNRSSGRAATSSSSGNRDSTAAVRAPRGNDRADRRR